MDEEVLSEVIKRGRLLNSQERAIFSNILIALSENRELTKLDVRLIVKKIIALND